MDSFRIPLSLRTAYLCLHRQSNARLASHGVTADQFVCLSILMHQDGLIQQELVKHAASDANTIRAMLLLLEKMQLIERIKHPQDARARLVKITAKGRQLFLSLVRELAPIHQSISQALSPDEISTLVALLDKIPGALQGQLNAK